MKLRLSRRKIIKRLLIATVAATTLTWQGGIVHADADFESPPNPSNNTIEVNASSYTLNGTTINYSGWFGQSYGSVIYGGLASSGDVSGNVFTFNTANTYQLFVYGGATGSGNVFNNTLNFNAGNFMGAFGGYAENGDVKNNTINISGGTFSNGGYPSVITSGAGTGEVSGNMINIWGGPNLSFANLQGYSNYSATHSGNMLNIAAPITAYSVEAFDNINFFIPASMNSGGTMLTVSGADLSGTAIRAAMQGGSNLDTGDTVTLIQSAGTITTDASTTYGKMTQAEYDAIKDRLPSGMLSTACRSITK